MKKFALIGAAGYVAPRHMKAIKENGCELVAAFDPFDSVGIIDRYFPKAAFFTEFERFDRHIDKLRRKDQAVDFMSICSPNYLHDAHIRFALRSGCDVICEKPLVLNPWNIDALEDIQVETGKTIHNILQLRLHKSVIALKNKIDNAPSDKRYDVDLTYITSRGNWYYTSWKGDEEKSGGIATNIGIHFFDMLIWIFGDVIDHELHLYSHDRASGIIRLKKADVKWFLSINSDTLPPTIQKSTYRSLKIENQEFEFSEGFEDLHNQSYAEVLKSNGFGLQEVRKSISLVHQIRNSKAIGLQTSSHVFASLEQSEHPFKKQENEP